MKQNDLSDVMYKLSCDLHLFRRLTVCVHSSLYKFHSHHLIDVHLYKCFSCLDINKKCLNHDFFLLLDLAISGAFPHECWNFIDFLQSLASAPAICSNETGPLQTLTVFQCPYKG